MKPGHLKWQYSKMAIQIFACLFEGQFNIGRGSTPKGKMRLLLDICKEFYQGPGEAINAPTTLSNNFFLTTICITEPVFADVSPQV